MKIALWDWLGFRPRTVVAVAAACAAAPTTAGAQSRQAPRYLESSEPGEGPHDIQASRGGFRLFGNGDLAFTGMRGTGSLGTYVSNVGPCDDQFTWGQCHTGLSRPNDWEFFEIPLIAGAPPTDFAKVRAAYPGAAAATGGGWTAIFNRRLFGLPYAYGPGDNSLGKLFSGATSTEDGSCQDHSDISGGFLSDGIQLLAGSNCSATWAPSGFDGPRRVGVGSLGSAETWKAVFDGDIPVAFDSGRFAWNEWQLPDTLFQALLGDFSTYGVIEDHNVDSRALYGSVTPGGTGNTTTDGWPLGLRWEFEAFTSAVPSVSSVMYWRARVINRSADVYGTGIDYDSLYLGFMPGTGNTGGGQNMANYYLPEYSAGMYTNSNNTGMYCSPPRNVFTGCQAFVQSGLYHGADFIVVLKSPLGDQRNKLFTRTPAGAPCAVGVDPFCDPTHPDRGDTVTINHGHLCGFGNGCYSSSLAVSDKRGFGMMASVEDAVVDGRACTTANSFTRQTFRTKDYPTVLCRFNKFVPGVHPWGEKGQITPNPASIWDWNDDGAPDTLFFDTCAYEGCVGTSMDTLPGGQSNAFGNVGGILTAGPVRLAAGDTTEFYAAFINDADSVRAFAQLAGAIDYYLNFYLGPEAAPTTRIVSTSVTAQVDTIGATQDERVQLFLSDDATTWVDPFITKLANDMDVAAPGTPLGDLRDANAGFELKDASDNVVAVGLVDALRYRAQDNLDALEVYKSCDGGTTFTASGDCLADPAQDTDGSSLGLGWRAYSTLRTDDFGGEIPAIFSDGSVDGGRNYLYVIIGLTRGAEFVVNCPATYCTSQSADAPALVTFAPVVRNPLSRSTSEANVTSVYVPISRQAGSRLANAAIQPRSSSVPFEVTFTDTATAGRYEAIFGNRIEIVETHQGVATGSLIRTDVTVSYQVTADVGGVATPVAVQSESFTRVGDEPVAVAARTDGSYTDDTVTSDSLVIRTLTGTGFALSRATDVLFATTSLLGSQATPSRIFGQSVFSGFTVSANQNASFALRDEIVRAISDNAKQQLGRVGLSDTVDGNIVRAQLAHWLGATASGSSGGQYRLTWTSEPFGLPGGIVLNRTDPAATDAEFDAALTGRPVGTTGLADQETSVLTGVALEDLVAVKAPFTLENVTYGRPVHIAMRARVSPLYRLGSGNDTLTVTVPDDQWVAGDQLFFLEDVEVDVTTSVGVVLDNLGKPMKETRRQVAFTAARVGCGTGVCNPVKVGTPGATPGQNAYNPGLRAGDLNEWHYNVPFSPSERITFDVTPPVTGSAIGSVSASDLSMIRVVPNPFIVYSTYQASFGANTAIENSRVAFTNVPPSGTIRVYTLAGQFAQQITWGPADLNGDGDLFYDLRTREGTELASGLYIWVLTTNVGGTKNVAKGKFVVIRGTTR